MEVKNKKIKVYLQYPWKFPDSPYYNYLFQYSPENVDYVNANKKNIDVILSRKKFIFSNLAKKIIRASVGVLNLPIINAHLTRAKDKYDIIHCAHCISRNKSPWVADFEGSWQFLVSMRRNKLGESFARKLLLDKNCKKIMPWTEAIKKDILGIFPEIKNKLEVVYPAVPIQKFKKKINKKVTILFVARYFWIKGGLIVLETLKEISKKYNVDTIVVSDAPEPIKEKYPEITFLKLMPRDKLVEYYKKADIFFYPSLIDTFGFALLEAMSFGLPVVTVNTNLTKSRTEIIQNGKNGYIIDINKKLEQVNLGEYCEKETIKKLTEKLSFLIKKSGLRKKMSKACLKIIKDGKFSIKRRNKQLRKIYEESLN